MAGNPRRPGSAAGNTFTKAEVDAFVQIFDRLQSGGVVSDVMLRQRPVRRLQEKFRRMKGKLDTIEREEAMKRSQDVE
jgi:hypothetical protein